MVTCLPCVNIRKAVNEEQIQDTNLYVTCMCARTQYIHTNAHTHIHAHATKWKLALCKA